MLVFTVPFLTRAPVITLAIYFYKMILFFCNAFVIMVRPHNLYEMHKNVQEKKKWLPHEFSIFLVESVIILCMFQHYFEGALLLLLLWFVFAHEIYTILLVFGQNKLIYTIKYKVVIATKQMIDSNK